MNNTSEYIDAMPLTDIEKAALPKSDIRAVHTALDGEHHTFSRDDDTPLGSVKARLEQAWPDSLAEGQLIKDDEGRDQLQAMPKATRSSMFPDPWRTNPVGRFWDRLRGRDVTPRYLSRLTKEEQASEQKWRTVGTIRRYILLLLTLAQTVVATWYMKTILPYQGWAFINPTDMMGQDLWVSFMQLLPYILQSGILLLFAVLFCWVSAGFWTALMGFLQLLMGRDKYSISASTVGDEPLNPEHRTALIMPICNEDVDRVFAGLRATWESVKATGNAEHFDVYILSDSYNPDICVAEQKAWMELIAEVQGEGQIFYRRRRRRVKRKSGNLDDFCRRWGGDYKYMVVLDADSVMTGRCLTQLVDLMEAHPQVGIAQTAPVGCGQQSLHARAQQYASRVLGRLYVHGLQFWQLGDSHYWGHNAILRVEPFMKHCALARLPGRGGLSGEILSHDFVEAALMRRAGFEVWLVPELDGSYEQLPGDLLDELQRDRRWCQGNLQNARLIAEPGLRPVHRALFATGAMSYLSAPLWLAYVVLGLTGGDAALLPGSSENPAMLGLWLMTGVMLLLLCTEMIIKYALGYELFAGGSGGLLWFAPVVETATGHESTGDGVNLSLGILIAHGWFYVVYLFACFRVWSLMRWGFVRFIVLALGGIEWVRSPNDEPGSGIRP